MSARLFASHRLAYALAALVGLIYVAPHAFFIVSLGDEYRGIPMLQTQNEDYYRSRIREVTEGHYSTGSFLFYEYKDAPPLTPPTLEFLYALPTLLFGVSQNVTIIASRFFLPAALFLLAYFLMLRLTATPRHSASASRLPLGPSLAREEEAEEMEKERRERMARVWSAIAGGLFVTLGFDLVNYRGIWRFLIGEEGLAGSFLVWSRLVHPIGGAILLFAFLLLLWSLLRGTRYRKSVVASGALFMALMFSSYFFSWGLAFSIWMFLLFICLIKKNYGVVRDLLLTMAGGILLATPYWFTVWRTMEHPLYEEAVLRSGLFLTHYPLLNKLMLALLVLYVVLVWGMPWFLKLRASVAVSFPRRRESSKDAVDLDVRFRGNNRENRGKDEKAGGGGGREKGICNKVEHWRWFLLAVMLGSLWVYVQQVLTGRTVWPYHFAQYTVALGIVVFLALAYREIRPRLKLLWSLGAGAVAAASVLYGVSVQAVVYRDSFGRYAALQNYAPVIEFLNAREKCVVFVNSDERRNWNYFVTAFTPCDIYAEAGVSLVMPYGRVYHGYLASLRLRGVDEEGIRGAMEDDPAQVREYLFGNWKGLLQMRDFPDFNDYLLEQRKARLPQDYRAFLGRDFREELARYRLDYILSIGPLAPSVLAEFPGTAFLLRARDMHLYQFR